MHISALVSSTYLFLTGMQIKNRIQLLEKAIIDSGVALAIDLGLPKPTTSGKDGESSGSQSFSTPTSEPDLSLGLDFQNLNSWSGDLAPDSLEETNCFTNHVFIDDWNPQELDLDLEPDSLPFMPNSNQQLEARSSVSGGSSQQDISPWCEVYTQSSNNASGCQVQTESLGRATAIPSSREEEHHQTPARGKLTELLSSADGSQVSVLSWPRE